ncbi:MAG: ABC transporter permease subunit [Treponema sp.]|jgi:putative aldouronate transport system permease protein|nr:ABC transporter permease subunit [Treponema sp.]
MYHKTWRNAKFWKKIADYRFVYLIFLPVAAFYIIFCYMPIFNTQTGGILMAFKHYRLNRNFFQMNWVGFQWFRQLWALPDFWMVMRNTLLISFGRLLFVFPMGIILAVMLNEVKSGAYKRVSQTIFTFPYFLSWVLVISIIKDLLLSNGLFNQLIRSWGGESVPFLSSRSIPLNLTLLFVTDIWKNAGWGAIIYLASMSGIDPSLYEAAEVDGANRWQRICHVTWPGILPTVVIMLILSCGNILNAGFDQIFNIRNSMNRNVIEILDTYIYHVGFGGAYNQSFSTAVGLFKAVINFALLLTANRIAYLTGQGGLFGKEANA